MAEKLSKIIEEFVEGKILTENLEEIVGERFGRYSKYIIQDRALPDVRDGLKPVQRRILYAMHRLGLTQDKPYKKSARIVGDVIGKYHPHGDSSVYEAIVRLSQDFKMREPLIDMHGNNGSIDGDSAAAMRYTEARMSKVSEFLLQDIDKRTVDYIPNFDDEEYEPIVLPSRFPNLLVNGATGISAGYATEIPPHNLDEIIKGIIKRIDNPQCSIESVLGVVKGPDFPTGAIVQGKEGIEKAFSTGRGRIIIKSKVEIEGQDIVITELPYEINKATLVRSMDEIRLKKKIDGIKEVRDESSSEGLRIVVEVKNAFDPEAILAFLHKKTDLTKSYNYNMVAINNKRPETMSLLNIFDAYIYHQKEVVTNRSNFDLQKAKRRLHIVEGIIYMVDILDEVIELIRNSKSKKDAKQKLTTTFVFTEEQAEAILTLQLHRLSQTDLSELEGEKNELQSLIDHLNDVLSNENELEKVIKKELRAIQRKAKSPRRTEIEEEIEKITVAEEDLIESEDVAVGVSKDGYLRVSSLRSYKATEAPDQKENDAFMLERVMSTHHTLLMFTNKGNYIYLPVFKIPSVRWKDMGTHVSHFAAIHDDEHLIHVEAVESFEAERYFLFTTQKNHIKMTKLSDFEVQRYNRTIKAISLEQGDKLTHVSATDEAKGELITISDYGHALRYHLEEVPVASTTAKGVKAMQLSKRDRLAASLPLENECALLALTSRGTIKRLDPHEIEKKKRALKGVPIISQPKTKPYLFQDLALINNAQYKNRAKVDVLTTKTRVRLTAFELKASMGETGRKVMRPEKEGRPFKLSVEPMEKDSDQPPINDFLAGNYEEKKQVSLFEETDE